MPKILRQNNESGTFLELTLLIGGAGALSIWGAGEMGYRVASGQNIGFITPALSMIIPVAGAWIGYKFNHLSAIGDPLSKNPQISGNCKIPSPLENSVRKFFIASSIQSAVFGIGYALGSVLR